MRLRHKSFQIVHMPFSAVLRVLVVLSDVDRVFRAHFLTVPAEYATEFVDLEHERVPVSVLVLAGHELDAIRRTDARAEAARYAARLAVFLGKHPVSSAPAR